MAKFWGTISPLSQAKYWPLTMVKIMDKTMDKLLVPCHGLFNTIAHRIALYSCLALQTFYLSKAEV
jgi:hypothetical protein